MHQLLIQWDGDLVEIMPVHETTSIVADDVPLWESNEVRCLSSKVWEDDELMLRSFCFNRFKQPMRQRKSETTSVMSAELLLHLE